MPTESNREAVVRLLIEAKGQAGIDDLDRKLKLVTGSIDALNDSYKVGDVTLTQYTKNVASLARQEKELTEQLAIAKSSTASAKQDVYELADSYELLEQEVSQATDQIKKNADALQASGNAAQKAKVNTVDVANTYNSVFTSAQKVGPALAAVNAQYDRIGSTPLGRELGNVSSGFGRVTTAAGKTVATTKSFGPGLQQVAYAMQDFTSAGGDLTRGLFNIQNNIPGIITGFGVSAGIAGAVSIATLAFGLALPKIKAFLASLDKTGVKDFHGQLEILETRIKELDAKPHKITVDMRELNTAKQVVDQIKSALAEVDKLQKSQQHYEKESGGEIEKAITEAPGGAQGVYETLHAHLAPGMRDEATKNLKAQEDRTEEAIKVALNTYKTLADSGNGAAAAGYLTTAKRLKKTLEDLGEMRMAAVEAVMDPEKGTLRAKIGTILEKAKTGAGAEQAAHQKTLVEILEKSGQGALAKEIAASTPAALKQGDEEVDAAEKFGERAKAGGEARRRNAAKLREDQQQHIDDVSKSDALQPEAQKFAKIANATGAVAEDAFETVRKQINEAILAKLRDKGIGDEGADKIANAASEGITKKAFTKVGQNESREQREERTDVKKVAAKQLAEKTKYDKEVKAKATILEHASGKDFQFEMEQLIAANRVGRAQGLPVAKTAKQEQQFLNSGMNYALPEAVAQRRAKERINANLLPRADGDKDVAAKATEDISAKAMNDLGAKWNNIGNQGLNAQMKLINIAATINNQVDQLGHNQNNLLQKVDQLDRAVKQKGRTNLKTPTR